MTKKLDEILSVVKKNTEAVVSIKKQFGGKIPSGLIHICENKECLLPNREFVSTNRKQKFCSEWCKHRCHYIGGDKIVGRINKSRGDDAKIIVTFRTNKECRDKIEAAAKHKRLSVSEYLHLHFTETKQLTETKTKITEAAAISFLKKAGYQFYGKIITNV